MRHCILRPPAGPPFAAALGRALGVALGLALGARAAVPDLGAQQRAATQGTSAGLHPYRPGVDVVDYDLTLDLPDTGRAIAGRAVLTVRRTAGVDTLVLDLLDLRVDSVLVDGRAAPFRRDSATLIIPLPGARPAAAASSPRASGSAGRAGGGSGNPAGGPPRQQTGAGARSAPHPTVAERGADSLTIAIRYGGAVKDGLIVSTDGQGRWMAYGDNWPNRARHWIPSVDHPSDKATVTWTVRAPAGRRVVANGTLLEETPLPIAGVPGTTSTPRTLTRWRESRPIPVYLMVVAAAPLAYYDLGPTACGRAELPGCVRQSVYVAPETRDFLPGPFAAATDILDFFSSLVAPFPYEKLAHVQSSTRFGGMENASAIFYADRPFRDRTMGVGIIAHETAHQWFGDAVTAREWSHLWLSEGFASYFHQLWVQHAAGDSAFRSGMAQLRTEIVESPVTAERPVLDTAETDYLKLLNTNSYQKGAWVLHMLRSTLGDSAFFRGVRTYYLKHRHRTALTDDLRRELEAASGRELGWFFDQWLRRPGVADANIAWRFEPAARRVVLDVVQTGRFGPYRFPLVVDVVDSRGTARRVVVQVPPDRQARVELPPVLGRAPARLVFDPAVELLGRVTEVGRRP